MDFQTFGSRSTEAFFATGYYTPSIHSKIPSDEEEFCHLDGPHLTQSAYKLPSSHHAIVNHERASYSVAPLLRSSSLDDMARERAAYLAQVQRLEPIARKYLRMKLEARTVAENVARGPDLPSIHQKCMQDMHGHRRHLLSWRYNEMGIGCARGDDGKLYMVQYFRHNPCREVPTSIGTADEEQVVGCMNTEL